MTNTNIHGTALGGKAQADSTEERQALAASNRAKYVEMCIKGHEAISEALAELKARSRS
jgi:hypothetical protein